MTSSIDNTLKGFNDVTNVTNGATQRGTRVVKKGNELDKNAFLRILTAELSNQDPMNAKDSTQYVSQMAQFAAMEQMTNLNSTMSFSGAQSLTGKTVALNDYDYMGRQYGGVVQSVEKNGDNIKLIVNVNEDGKYLDKEFDLKDLKQVLNVPNQQFSSLNSNLDFLISSSFVGKNVKAVDENGIWFGKVKSSVKTNEGIKVNVDVVGRVLAKYLDDEGTGLESNIGVRGVYSSNEDTTLKVRYLGEPENKYQYAILHNNSEDGIELWKDLNNNGDIEEVQGLKIDLPEKNPLFSKVWSTLIEGVEPKNESFLTDNVLEVSEGN